MREQSSENDEGVKAVRRFFAFLAILVVMVNQAFVYAIEPKEEIQYIPLSVWINIAGVILGVIIFLWSQAVHPGPRMQAFITRSKFSGSTFWIIAALAFSLISVLAMLLFQN